MDENNLKKEILRTIIWFDLFSHPLSSWELFKFLNFKIDYNNFLLILPKFFKELKIKNIHSFWCLEGRDDIIIERFKRFNYFKNKIKKAEKFTKIISFFPAIQGVFVSNIIGDHNLKKGSDIDFFIITKSGKIWLTRFFCAFIAKILGLRPNKRTKENKICLSFYIDESNLNLEPYLYNEKDWYFVYWLASLEPIFFRKNILDKFWSNNIWLNKYLPNFLINYNNFKEEIVGKDFKISGAEKMFQSFQLKIMPNELKEQSLDRSGVILGDHIIKLILDDKRPEFIDKFAKATQFLEDK
ncbi:MAG TPA: hypothetical protein PK142_03350 [bacterium]|nr:hypothetical protein [bacterium]